MADPTVPVVPCARRVIRGAISHIYDHPVPPDFRPTRGFAISRDAKVIHVSRRRVKREIRKAMQRDGRFTKRQCRDPDRDGPHD